MPEPILQVNDLISKILAWTNLNNIGSIASIAGFIVTVLVFLSLRRIRRFYFVRVRIPKLAESLSSRVSKISNYMNDYENSNNNILVELAEIEAVLKSMKGKVIGDSKKSVKTSIRKISEINRSNISYDLVMENYVQLRNTLEVIKQSVEDWKWEK